MSPASSATSPTRRAPAHLLRSLERAGKYKDMISKNLREQGVPQDLIYLAVAESGFQPQALNAPFRRWRHVQFHANGRLRPRAQRLVR